MRGFQVLGISFSSFRGFIFELLTFRPSFPNISPFSLTERALGMRMKTSVVRQGKEKHEKIS